MSLKFQGTQFTLQSRKTMAPGVTRITGLPPPDSHTPHNGFEAMGLGRLKKSKREAKLIAIPWSL